MTRPPFTAPLFAALACLSLIACREEAAAGADPLAMLGTGVEWRVTEIDGQPVPEGVTVTIVQPEPGLLAGSSGCNRYSGRMTAEGTTLKIGALAGTRMMCPDPQMQAEQAFHSNISRIDGAQITEGLLELTREGAVMIRATK